MLFRSGKSQSDQPQLVPSQMPRQLRVLCMGVHTPLDAAAAEMLSLLLNRSGILARTETVGRIADLGAIDLSAVDLVWLSSLDGFQSLAHVRYMIRRLRRLAPSLVICAGLWDDTPTEALADKLNSDHYAGSLETALEKTLSIGLAHDSDILAPFGETLGHATSVRPPQLGTHSAA